MAQERDIYLSDVEQKQQIIQRLQKRLDKRVEGIERLIAEVGKERDDILAYKTEHAKLNRELKQNEEAAKVTIRKEELISVTREDLERSYSEIAIRQRVEKNRLREYVERIQTLQNYLIERNEVEKKFLRLEKKHHSQSSVILNLQEKVSKVDKYEKAADQQLLLIQKLEKKLADCAGVVVEPDTTLSSARFSRAQDKNVKLHERIQVLSAGRGSTPEDRRREEICHYMRENEQLNQDNAMLRAGVYVEDENDLQHLMQQSDFKERVACLQTEIAARKQGHGAAIAALKAEIARASVPRRPVLSRKEPTVLLEDSESRSGSALKRAMSPRTRSLYEALTDSNA